MTHESLKSHYQYFLKGHEGYLHFAAHSHHFWPDVTRAAHLQYWDDSSLLSDRKWEKIFGEVIPKAQSHVARILNLKSPEQIVFAPNTHELASRILSLFLDQPGLSVLTTSSEFHSWRRQLARLEELSQVSVESVSTQDLLNNREKFFSSLKEKLKNRPDLFFISQVFFDSGLALTDEEIWDLCESAPKETVIVIDGYHAFGALPVNLSRLEGRIFYLAGGYKYAQGGEGAAFLVVPKGSWRPTNTGWFAEIGELALPPGKNVAYPQDAMAFLGSTQDPSGLYRLNATWDHFAQLGLNVESIHLRIQSLQKAFLKLIPQDFLNQRNLRLLSLDGLPWHGHFLTFEAASAQAAEALENQLKEAKILIDRRGKGLRFGMGLYHDPEDIQKLATGLLSLK